VTVAIVGRLTMLTSPASGVNITASPTANLWLIAGVGQSASLEIDCRRLALTGCFKVEANLLTIVESG
jgi:hypothetical protein